ncbi:MAG: Fe-S-containing protein [Spirochaetaceae bacterium]|jgi:uncharacterized membrane protein|nr:Fe-S-containing protein [Spirochaetaceae bacterium]
MLRYLVQVVQNLLATGILAALLFAALYCGEEAGGWEAARKRKARALWGCAIGAGASLVLAVLRRTTALISRGFINLWILSFAVISGILYILFQWGLLQKPLRKIPFLKNRPPVAEAIPDYVSALLLGALLFYAMPTIFLYPTEFALAGESVFTTDFLFKLIGFTAGLAVVILTVLALYKTGRAMPEPFLRVLLTIALSVNICNQLTVIVQFLLARRIIPMVRWLFRIIVAVSSYNFVFLYVLMGLGFLLPLAVFIKSFNSLPVCNNPAEHRKLRFFRRTNRRRCLTVAAGFALSVFLFTFVKSYIERGVVLSPAEPMTLAGTEIIIPITQVEDGHLHRFVYTASDNTEMRFIVIRKNAAAYGVGLDACDICGPTGYYERKDGVICRLCDVVMNISTIGFKGGCNPVPLAYSLRSGSMIIETSDLENEKARFK